MTLVIPSVSEIKEIAYPEFSNRFKYTPDQHITICGPTGCGKSVLITDLIIPRQKYLVYFSTKPRDGTIEKSALAGKDFGWTDDPRDIHPWIYKKWVVGLKSFGDPEEVLVRHKDLFSKTLRQCFPSPKREWRMSNGFAMDIDEGRYCCDNEYLGLKSLVAQYYIQGRSDEKSVTLATQRPRWVPLEAFDQATHLFFFNDEDEDNVTRMAQMSGANKQLFRDTIPHLEITENKGGQFLYYNRATKAKLISKVEL